MNVIINGKPADVKAANLKELAAELNLPEKGIAVAVNNAMVPRTEWENTALSANDNVVIIKAACGG
ncbi:MAG: sulfur carrier protein ThiS [Paludibacteraceae bacterium]|jgi:sulfur carrier protein|nr:sulfur carrier protein ThiS [Paludibacteraceae bacterium]